MRTYGYGELGKLIKVIRLCKAKISKDTGAAEHYAGETSLAGLFFGYSPYINKASSSDSVIAEKFLNFVDAITKLTNK